jgi:hypothetical protein
VLRVEGEDLDEEAPFFKDAAAIRSLPAGSEQEARRNLHSLLLDAGDLAWRHAVDHVRSLEHDLFMDPPPVWSPLSLARVTLEGCAFTGHLFDPEIGLRQRLARAAALRVAEARNEIGAAGNFGEVEQAGAAAQLQAAEQLVAHAGAEPRLNRRGRVMGYSIGGEFAPIDYKIAAQVRHFLPDWAQGAYQLMSGAAHGRPWMIVRGRSSGEDWAGEAATVLAAVMAVMAALEAGIAVWGAYFGLDVSVALKAMKEDRLAFLVDAPALAHGSA